MFHTNVGAALHRGGKATIFGVILYFSAAGFFLTPTGEKIKMGGDTFLEVGSQRSEVKDDKKRPPF